jgi:hypothetical protein
MKKIVMLVILGLSLVLNQSLFAAAGPEPVDLRRQIYELNALMRVDSLEVDVWDNNYTWHVAGKATFVDGEAELSLDITPGPDYYRATARWNDVWGSPLFQCYESKVVWMAAGVNVKDFAMRLNESPTLHFKIDGPASSDAIWVGRNRADFSGGYWHVPVDRPWELDLINVVWTGHGGWNIGVDPSFPFGSVICLTAADMDPTNNSVSQMEAISYSDSGSWTYNVIGYGGLFWDENQQCLAMELVSEMPTGTKAMVFLSYWDQDLGTVEYFNTTGYVDKLGVIRVMLCNTWFDHKRVSIRVVWKDSKGHVWQTWVPVPWTQG